MQTFEIGLDRLNTREFHPEAEGHSRLLTWLEAPGGPAPLWLRYSCPEDGGGAEVYPGPEFIEAAQLLGPEGWTICEEAQAIAIASGFRPRIFNEKTMKPVLDHAGLLPSGCGGGFAWNSEDGRVVGYDVRNGEEAFELGMDGEAGIFLEAEGRLWIADHDAVTRLEPKSTAQQSVPLDPTPELQLHGVFVAAERLMLWRCFGKERELLSYDTDGKGLARWMLEPDPDWSRAHGADLAVGARMAAVRQGGLLLSIPLGD
jgi:hypothetical protein